MRGGGEFDGGHDIVIVVFRLIRDGGSIGMLLTAAGALCLLAVVAALYLFRNKAQAIIEQILSRTFEFRLSVAIGMLASAVTLDLLPSYKAAILEEVLELVASGVLLLAVLALHRQTAGRVREQVSPTRRLVSDEAEPVGMVFGQANDGNGERGSLREVRS